MKARDNRIFKHKHTRPHGTTEYTKLSLQPGVDADLTRLALQSAIFYMIDKLGFIV